MTPESSSPQSQVAVHSRFCVRLHHLCRGLRAQHLHISNHICNLQLSKAKDTKANVVLMLPQVQAPAPLSLELHEATKNTMKAKYRLGWSLMDQTGSCGRAVSVIELLLYKLLSFFWHRLQVALVVLSFVLKGFSRVKATS